MIIFLLLTWLPVKCCLVTVIDTGLSLTGTDKRNVQLQETKMAEMVRGEVCAVGSEVEVLTQPATGPAASQPTALRPRSSATRHLGGASGCFALSPFRTYCHSLSTFFYPASSNIYIQI